jgi:hypothetical protein
MDGESYRFRHSALGESMQTLNVVNDRARNCITDDLLLFRDEQALAAAKRLLHGSEGQLLKSVVTLLSAQTSRMIQTGLHHVLDQQRHMVSALTKAMDQAIPLAGEVGVLSVSSEIGTLLLYIHCVFCHPCSHADKPCFIRILET